MKSYLDPLRRPKSVEDMIETQYKQLGGHYVFIGSRYYDYKLVDFHKKFAHDPSFLISFNTDTILKTDKREQLTVLDIGSASGTFLAANTSERIHCTGLSAESKFSVVPNTVIGDANNLQKIDAFKDKKFDYIVSSYTFMHLSDPLGTLVQAYDMLEDNGYLVIDGFDIPGMEKNLRELFYYLSLQGYEIFTHLSEKEPNVGADFRFMKHDPDNLQINCLIIKKTKPKLDLPVSYSSSEKNISYQPSNPKLFSEMDQKEIKKYWLNQNIYSPYYIDKTFGRSITKTEEHTDVSSMLRIAATVGDASFIKDVISKNGIDAILLANSTKEGSLLHVAINNGNLETAQYLFDLLKKDHPDIFSQTDENGLTVAHCCAKSGDQFINLSKEIFALKPELITTHDKNGSLLHVAINNKNLETAQYLFSLLKKDHNDILSLTDDKGFTIAHCCAKSGEGFIPLCKDIFANNPELKNAQDRTGKRPLEIAIDNNNSKLIRELFDISSVDIVSSLKTLFHEKPNLEIKQVESSTPSLLTFEISGKDGLNIINREYQRYLPGIFSQQQLFAIVQPDMNKQCFELTIEVDAIPVIANIAEKINAQLHNKDSSVRYGQH